MPTKKVALGMTERDLENVDMIEQTLHSRSKADAVGSALETTASLLEKVIQENAEIIIRHKDGTIERVLIPGLSLRKDKVRG